MATQTITLPPPYKGQQDRIPVAAMEHPYCEVLENYNIQNGIVKVRKGDVQFAKVAAGYTPMCLSTYGMGSTQQLFLTNYQSSGTTFRWYDMSAGGTISTVAHSKVVSGGNANMVPVYFNGYLYFLSTEFNPATNAPQQYNGTTWADSTFTWPTNFVPIGGCAHRNRVYFFDSSGAAFCYGGISAVSGVLTKRDYAELLSAKADIVGMKSITLEEGNDRNALLAFVLSSGEVLMYSGAWPDSPDWALAKRYRISPPVSANPLFDAMGDTYIITETGLISLKSLISKGELKARLESITAQISNRWRQVASQSKTTLRANHVRGVWDSTKDRIMVAFSYVVRDTGALDTAGTVRFVYDITSGAWSEHIEAAKPCRALVFHKDDTYYTYVTVSTSEVWKVEGDTDSAGMVCKLKTAPLPISKFGINVIGGVEIILKSDLLGETAWYLVGDLGVVTTAAQLLPDGVSTIQKTMINAGIESSHVQLYALTSIASTGTVGQEIYGLNVWYQPGGLR